jgi:hypothetical protein
LSVNAAITEGWIIVRVREWSNGEAVVGELGGERIAEDEGDGAGLTRLPG